MIQNMAEIIMWENNYSCQISNYFIELKYMLNFLLRKWMHMRMKEGCLRPGRMWQANSSTPTQRLHTYLQWKMKLCYGPFPEVSCWSEIDFYKFTHSNIWKSQSQKAHKLRYAVLVLIFFLPLPSKITPNLSQEYYVLLI